VSARREPAVFAAAIGLLWLLFFIQAWNAPVLLDDWYQLTWHRHHPLTLASIWEYASYNYFHFNPRVGDVFLMLVNGPPVIHLVVTPLVQIGLLVAAFALAFARLPRPTYRDLQLLLFIQVAIWIAIPIPGVVYFYRPFATNYLWAFATTLWLFVPYRIALANPDDRARHWLIVPMFVLGWFAGMSNEHTGPTAMVAMLIFVGYAWKQGRLRPWMIAGALGIFVGYPMLFFAPGQRERYAGMATRNTPLVMLSERGLAGCFEVIVDFVVEVQLATHLTLVALLASIGATRARGEKLRALETPALIAIGCIVLATGSIVVTLFASPTVGERLFLAPGVLVVIALAIVVDYAFLEATARRLVVWICAGLFAYHAVRFVYVYAVGKRENDRRIAILESAPDDTEAKVPPYTMWKRTRWWWGDDFRYASLRQYVGNEVYDLSGIVLDRRTRWAEPTPSESYVARRVFDPPLPPDAAAKIAPMRYIPTFWEWDLVQLRRAIAFDGLGEHAGHKLVRYTVQVERTEFEDPKHRPFLVIDWTPSSLEFIDGLRHDDDRGQPYIQVWDQSVPPDLVDTYVYGCGTTVRVDPVSDPDITIGPIIPVKIACRTVYAAAMCTPDECWHVGRYWR